MLRVLGHELLRGFLSPEKICRPFLTAYHLTSFLKRKKTCSPSGGWGVRVLQRVNYATLKFKKHKCVIKVVKVVLKQFKLAKQSCNMQEQLIPCRF